MINDISHANFEKQWRCSASTIWNRTDITDTIIKQGVLHRVTLIGKWFTNWKRKRPSTSWNEWVMRKHTDRALCSCGMDTWTNMCANPLYSQSYSTRYVEKLRMIRLLQRTIHVSDYAITRNITLLKISTAKENQIPTSTMALHLPTFVGKCTFNFAASKNQWSSAFTTWRGP